MTWEREKQLRQDYGAKLTDEELAEGWHFCPEYDFDLMLRSECGLCKTPAESESEE